jgi:hypothetical protein
MIVMTPPLKKQKQNPTKNIALMKRKAEEKNGMEA